MEYKFKVGDKVKIISGIAGIDFSMQFDIGDVLEITQDKSFCPNATRIIDGEKGCSKEDSIEIIKESKEEQPIFKIGDKVEAIDKSFGWGSVGKGNIGVVQEVVCERERNRPESGLVEYLVDFPTQSGWRANSRDLRLAFSEEKMSIWGDTWRCSSFDDTYVTTFGAPLVLSSKVCSGVTKINIKGNKKTFMEDIVKFAKNLTLSSDEKLLREQGLKDECGNYSYDAKEIVIQKLLKENEPYLIEIAKAKKEESNKK